MLVSRGGFLPHEEREKVSGANDALCLHCAVPLWESFGLSSAEHALLPDALPSAPCVLCFVRDGFLRQILALLIFAASVFTDWAVLAPLFTAVFARYRTNPKAIRIAWPILSALVALSSLPSAFTPYGILNAVFAGVFPLLAGLVVQYDCSGERSERHRTFNKWFFYVFYPAHLTVLMIIKTAVGL